MSPLAGIFRTALADEQGRRDAIFAHIRDELASSRPVRPPQPIPTFAERMSPLGGDLAAEHSQTTAALLRRSAAPSRDAEQVAFRAGFEAGAALATAHALAAIVEAVEAAASGENAE